MAAKQLYYSKSGGGRDRRRERRKFTDEEVRRASEHQKRLAQVCVMWIGLGHGEGWERPLRAHLIVILTTATFGAQDEKDIARRYQVAERARKAAAKEQDRRRKEVANVNRHGSGGGGGGGSGGGGGGGADRRKADEEWKKAQRAKAQVPYTQHYCGSSSSIPHPVCYPLLTHRHPYCVL